MAISQNIKSGSITHKYEYIYKINFLITQ